MGVSMIRWVPNSCTSPVSVLNGCPASATSSPMRKTRGSRRISSAIASLTASPYVSSRSLMPVSCALVSLVDDPVGPGQERRRHLQPDPAGRRRVDGQRDPADLLDRNRAGAGPIQDLVGESREALEVLGEPRPVA